MALRRGLKSRLQKVKSKLEILGIEKDRIEKFEIIKEITKNRYFDRWKVYARYFAYNLDPLMPSDWWRQNHTGDPYPELWEELDEVFAKHQEYYAQYADVDERGGYFMAALLKEVREGKGAPAYFPRFFAKRHGEPSPTVPPDGAGPDGRA